MAATITQLNPNKMTASEQTQTYARCYVVLYTIEDMREKLVAERGRRLNDFKERLSAATKAYREPLRDEDNRTASQKVRAQLFLDCMDGVAERDAINSEKKEELGEIDGKIKKLDEVKAEARAARKGDGNQTKMFDDEAEGAIPHMSWATPGSRTVLYSALLTIEKLGDALDPSQADLLADLASAQTGEMDFGLEPSEAIEQDVDDEIDEDEDDEAEETDPEF